MYQNNSTAWGNTNAGQLLYTGQYTQAHIGDSTTGVGYVDFLLGQTQTWLANATPEYGGREKLPQIFVQDDYKIKPNLTLNFGLRYQIQTGWSEVKGNEASFDPTVLNPVTNTLGAIWFGSTHANGRTHNRSRCIQRTKLQLQRIGRTSWRLLSMEPAGGTFHFNRPGG